MSAKSNAATVTVVRKITPKIIMGSKPKLIDNKKTDLCSIAGIASSLKTTPTNFGESTCFIGEFIAVNLQTGEVFKSNRAYFPKLIEEEMTGPVNAKENVEFAFRLSILPDEKSNTGYVYYNEPVHKIQDSDQLKSLAEKIGVVMGPSNPQLPAPEVKETAKDSGKDSAKGKVDDKNKGKK
jgi:hypothetical protein